MMPTPGFQPPVRRNNSVLIWVLVGSIVFGGLFIGGMVLFLMSGVKQMQENPAYAVRAKYLPPEYQTHPAAGGWAHCAFTYAGFEMDLPANPEMGLEADPYSHSIVSSSDAFVNFGIESKTTAVALTYCRYPVEADLMVEQAIQSEWQLFGMMHGERQGKWLVVKKSRLGARDWWAAETDTTRLGNSAHVFLFGVVDGNRSVTACVSGAAAEVKKQAKRMAESLKFGQEKPYRARRS